LLLLQDAKVVDNACLALSRIAQSFSNNPPLLASLSNNGLISNAAALVRRWACLSQSELLQAARSRNGLAPLRRALD
jgi:hypothetical protein